jgi:hypothetical protein
MISASGAARGQDIAGQNWQRPGGRTDCARAFPDLPALRAPFG